MTTENILGAVLIVILCLVGLLSVLYIGVLIGCLVANGPNCGPGLTVMP